MRSFDSAAFAPEILKPRPKMRSDILRDAYLILYTLSDDDPPASQRVGCLSCYSSACFSFFPFPSRFVSASTLTLCVSLCTFVRIDTTASFLREIFGVRHLCLSIYLLYFFSIPSSVSPSIHPCSFQLLLGLGVFAPLPLCPSLHRKVLITLPLSNRSWAYGVAAVFSCLRVLLSMSRCLLSAHSVSLYLPR